MPNDKVWKKVWKGLKGGAQLSVAFVAFLALIRSCQTDQRRKTMHEEVQALERKMHEEDQALDRKMHEEDQALVRQMEEMRYDREKPRLVALGKAFRPLDRDRGTFVPIQNIGCRMAAITEILFRRSQRTSEPPHRVLTAVERWPRERVVFCPAYFDEGLRAYVKQYPSPVGIPGGGRGATFVFSIVDKNNVGKRYVGSLAIHYGREGPLVIDEVELDVLAKPASTALPGPVLP